MTCTFYLTKLLNIFFIITCNIQNSSYLDPSRSSNVRVNNTIIYYSLSIYTI